MALQFSFDSDFGATFATAYARINTTIVDTPLDDTQNTLNVTCDIYANGQARTDGKLPVGRISVTNSFDETQPMSKTDLYAWLKTQPGFEGAIDV